ncbi:hypothetical protein AGR1B_Lc60167 [Agrobacterium fabacearum S56]|nr:hypothetical protein AGR1B_Lc60167 [Agrobacterium fabacearum S56]
MTCLRIALRLRVAMRAVQSHLDVKRIQMPLLAAQIRKMRLNAELEVQIVDLRDRIRSALRVDDLGAGQRIHSQTLPAHP